MISATEFLEPVLHGLQKMFGPKLSSGALAMKSGPIVQTLTAAAAALCVLGPAAAATGPPRAAVRAKPARSKPARYRPGRAVPTRIPVLDVQKLRVVEASRQPNVIPTCDVLILGGGLGGVAAARALARARMTFIIAEPTSMLGGQLTAQGVCLPDENRFIETPTGIGTRSYREMRDSLRKYYAAQPGIVPGRERSPGQAWVSNISGEPAAWETVIRDGLKPSTESGLWGQVLTRHQVTTIRRFSHNGRYHYADLVNLDTGKITRVAARVLLDASEFGDGLELAGSPWTLGQEARSEHNEPHAPEKARPDWVQSLTYCFAVRFERGGKGPGIPRPAEYESFKALGEYTLGYDYVDRGRVFYKVFERVPGSGGPFWTYRRIIAASSFRGNERFTRDIALINWRGNDFHAEQPIGKSLSEQIRILKRAKEFSLGFLYWLQNEAPRDEGGVGYPEMRLAPEVMASEDGLALHPYIRESRRLKARFTLNENHLLKDPAAPDRKWGVEFSDTVGIALYAVDIHPAHGEPPLLSPALPYHIPLGAFIPKSGPDNVLPAAKNLGGTRLAMASARMHPTEWHIGEVSGELAAYALEKGLTAEAVWRSPEHVTAFQQRLEANGVPIRWSPILK